MKIEIVVGDSVLKAHLEDNPTARDFAALLPIELELEDYGNIEKVSDLPNKLSRAEAPNGYKPSTKDITYYAPWGNLAIFLKDFGYSGGLIRIGRIDSDMGALSRSGTLKVLIRKAEEAKAQ